MRAYPSAVTMMLFLASWTVSAVQAQEPGERLVGTWDLSVADSDFGRTTAADSIHMKIERADDRLVMRRDLHFARLGGARFVTFDMPTDGETYEAETADGAQNVRVSWDGPDLVLVTEAQSNVGPVEVVDRMSSENGRRLVIDRLVDVPGMGLMEATIVFVRRE